MWDIRRTQNFVGRKKADPQVTQKHPAHQNPYPERLPLPSACLDGGYHSTERTPLPNGVKIDEVPFFGLKSSHSCLFSLPLILALSFTRSLLFQPIRSQITAKGSPDTIFPTFAPSSSIAHLHFSISFLFHFLHSPTSFFSSFPIFFFTHSLTHSPLIFHQNTHNSQCPLSLLAVPTSS